MSVALRLNDRNTLPPKIYAGQIKSYAYQFQENGQWIEASSFTELIVACKKHAISNNLPIGLLFEDNIDKWIAARVPQNFTALEDGRANVRIRRDDWPMWAKTVALLRNDTDEGVGSTIERAIGPIGGDAFKKYYQTLTGHPCACSIRRDSLNESYPYDV